MATAVVAAMAVAALVGGPAAGAPEPEAAAALGYWTDDTVTIVDEDAAPLGVFPAYDHFSFNRSMIAGERPGRRHSRDRIIGTDIASGERLFRIDHATNPVVGTSGKVLFLPTMYRDDYTTTVWMRGVAGGIRRIVRFKPGPGLPGVRHGMRGGGAPLDLAVDDAGRYVAVAFGLEPLRSFDVWIVDVKTREVKRMTRGENSHNPSMSPHGSKLAVRVESPDPCPDPLYGEILIGKIRVLDREGGGSRSLTDFDCELFYDTPRWIDEDTLLAVRVTKDATQTYGYDLDIVEIDAESGAISEVVTEGNPCCITVSPSLGKVAYGFSDRGGFSVLDLTTRASLDYAGDVYVPHLAGENRF